MAKKDKRWIDKRLVLLNTSILTSFGEFSYTPRTLQEAREILNMTLDCNSTPISAIGHESTAQIMSELLGYPVKVNRINFKMEPGDGALVFKLNGRPTEGKILSIGEIEQIGYSWGYLAMYYPEK